MPHISDIIRMQRERDVKQLATDLARLTTINTAYPIPANGGVIHTLATLQERARKLIGDA